MVTKSLFAGFCIVMCAVSTIGHAEAAHDATDCQAHFTVDGNFLLGRKYSTWVFLPGAARPQAYARVYSSVAKDGWSIVNADKDAGIISATQAVSYGRGLRAPMIIIVEDAGKGSRVSVTFRTGGAQAVREEAVRAKLCAYLGSPVSP